MSERRIDTRGHAARERTVNRAYAHPTPADMRRKNRHDYAGMEHHMARNPCRPTVDELAARIRADPRFDCGAPALGRLKQCLHRRGVPVDEFRRRARRWNAKRLASWLGASENTVYMYLGWLAEIRLEDKK